MTIDIEKALAFVGAVTPISSIISSKINGQIRSLKEENQEIPKWLIQVGILFNLLAVNTDKVAQYKGMAK
jgi:hypothetical protein